MQYILQKSDTLGNEVLIQMHVKHWLNQPLSHLLSLAATPRLRLVCNKGSALPSQDPTVMGAGLSMRTVRISLIHLRTNVVFFVPAEHKRV